MYLNIEGGSSNREASTTSRHAQDNKKWLILFSRHKTHTHITTTIHRPSMMMIASSRLVRINIIRTVIENALACLPSLCVDTTTTIMMTDNITEGGSILLVPLFFSTARIVGTGRYLFENFFVRRKWNTYLFLSRGSLQSRMPKNLLLYRILFVPRFNYWCDKDLSALCIYHVCWFFKARKRVVWIMIRSAGRGRSSSWSRAYNIQHCPAAARRDFMVTMTHCFILGVL